MIDFMKETWPVFVGAVGVFALGAAVVLSIQSCSDSNWREYAAEHECKPTNCANDEVTPVCTTTNKITTCSNSRTTSVLWVCADGERVWR